MNSSDTAAWKAWAAAASPELRQLFDSSSRSCLAEVRHRYPPACGPNHHRYHELRAESVEALDCLALTIQSEHDDDAVY